MNSQIYFFYKDVKITFHERRRVKSFIPHIFLMHKKRLDSLTCIFCTDAELLAINQQFLKHNYYTDIITFNLAPEAKEICGEIYISVERVRENAALHKTNFKEELLRVIFHGVLHLCGFKDKTVKEKALMRAKEAYFLNAYKRFVPRET